jgi:8-oxo-dGTP diphosphatase
LKIAFLSAFSGLARTANSGQEQVDDLRRTRIPVVAGILCNAKRQVLITDRSRARSLQHLWEFPGGKVEEGESANVALERELAEELGIETLKIDHLGTIKHDYPDSHVSIDFFVVSAWSGTPTGMEGQKLCWVHENELDARMLLPADEPIVAALAARRAKN